MTTQTYAQTHQSLDDAVELCQLWLALERGAIRAAGATTGLPSSETCSPSATPDAIVAQHANFHRRVTAAADNARVTALFDEVITELAPYLLRVAEAWPDLLTDRGIGQLYEQAENQVATHVAAVTAAIAESLSPVQTDDWLGQHA